MLRRRKASPGMVLARAAIAAPFIAAAVVVIPSAAETAWRPISAYFKGFARQVMAEAATGAHGSPYAKCVGETYRDAVMAAGRPLTPDSENNALNQARSQCSRLSTGGAMRPS